MRILVIGPGATGGYFGARPAEAGRDVTFLARPARAPQLPEHGLTVVGVDRTTTLYPRVITAAQIDGPFDLVLVAVKAAALDSALTMASLTLGELSAERTERVLSALTTLSVPGIDADLAEDIVAAMWHKWVFILASGVVTCLRTRIAGEGATARANIRRGLRCPCLQKRPAGIPESAAPMLRRI